MTIQINATRASLAVWKTKLFFLPKYILTVGIALATTCAVAQDFQTGRPKLSEQTIVHEARCNKNVVKIEKFIGALDKDANRKIFVKIKINDNYITFPVKLRSIFNRPGTVYLMPFCEVERIEYRYDSVTPASSSSKFYKGRFNIYFDGRVSDISEENLTIAQFYSLNE